MVRLLLTVVLVAACSRGTLLDVPRGPAFPEDDAAPDSSLAPIYDAGFSKDGETSPVPVTDTGADSHRDGLDAFSDPGADVAYDTATDVAYDTATDVAFDEGADVSRDGGPPRGVEFVEPSNETVFHPRTGGDLLEDACDSGEALIGLYGIYATYDWFAQLGGVCGRLSVSCSHSTCEVTIARTEDLPLRGGSGTFRTWDSLCPPHHLVTGFRGRAGSFIDMLTLRCSPLEIIVEETGYSLRLGPHTDVTTVGNYGGSDFSQTDCLAGTAVTDVRTYAHTIHDGNVNGLSFGCSTPSLVY